MRNVGDKCVPIEPQRTSVPTQLHCDRQRVAEGIEVVAEHAVERGQDRFAPRRRIGVRKERPQACQGGIDTGTDRPRYAVDAAVHEACDAARSPRTRLPTIGAIPAMLRCKLLDDVGHAFQRIDREAARAAQIGFRRRPFRSHVFCAAFSSSLDHARDARLERLRR
jgi:hypothetical protein